MPLKRFLIVLLLLPACSWMRAHKGVDSLQALAVKYKSSNADSAIFFLKQALTLAQQNSLVKETSVLKNLLGQFYAGKSDFATALCYFRDNLDEGRRTRNNDLLSRAGINIANIYLTQGKYNSAMDHYLEALRFVEQKGDKRLLYVNYLCLGITTYYLKQYDKSLGYYRQCLVLSTEEKNSSQAAYCYNTMGVICRETGQTAKALDYFLKTDSIAGTVGDSVILSHNLGNLGELYAILHNEAKALPLLERGVALTRRFNDNKGLGENLVLLGNALVRFHQYAKAVPHYREALALGQSIGINEITKNSYLGLSQASEGLGDFANAYAYHRAYSRVNDSLFNTTSSQQIADMQTRYDTEKKESENILLAKDNNIKSLEIRQHRNQRNLLIAGFSLALVVVGLLYNSSRLKHRNKILMEKELRNRAVFQAQEKEKMQLSKELHDGLGPLLSLIKMNVSAIKTEAGSEKLLGDVRELTSQSIREVRSISHALMPSLLQKQGLQAALSEFVEQVNAAGAINVRLNYQVDTPLNAETEINIYRITQEAVNNTIRHSGAASADVSVTQNGGALKVVIADDGCGMNGSAIRGNGLNNIHSRVDFLKGRLDLETGPGKGTRFTITIPLHEQQPT